MSALRAGLVDRVVPADALEAEVRRFADVLASRSALSQRATKEVAWRTATMGWIESVRFGETMRKVAGATEDVVEGIAAWREKRKPIWRGR